MPAPCPFCGFPHASVAAFPFLGDGFRVQCGRCGALGPMGERPPGPTREARDAMERANAIAAWNARAPIEPRD